MLLEVQVCHCRTCATAVTASEISFEEFEKVKRVERRGEHARRIFIIPGALREFTAGNSRVEIEHSPSTVAEALSAPLHALPPASAIASSLSRGQVREHNKYFHR